MVEHVGQVATPADHSHPLQPDEARANFKALSHPGFGPRITLVSAGQVAQLRRPTERRRVLGAASARATEAVLHGTPIHSQPDLLKHLARTQLSVRSETLCWNPWLGLGLQRIWELPLLIPTLVGPVSPDSRSAH